nr:hypothetical protein [Methylobacterium sp. ZNC0032]
MADNKNVDLDAELHRILAGAAERMPVEKYPVQRAMIAKPLASRRIWPWQVPQVPAYTSDGASQKIGG